MMPANNGKSNKLTRMCCENSEVSSTEYKKK